MSAPDATTEARGTLLERARELLDRQQAWIPILLRLSVGATFVYHGHGKLFGDAAWAETAAGLAAGAGLPEALSFLGYFPVFAEFCAGIGLILGALTRLSALSLAGVMAGALSSHALVRGQAFDGWEWQLTLFCACLTLVVIGPGVLSLDHLVLGPAEEDEAESA